MKWAGITHEHQCVDVWLIVLNKDNVDFQQINITTAQGDVLVP